MSPETRPGAASRLGAFARIFQRDSAPEIADAFAGYGLTQVQLNLSALGLPTIPQGSQLEAIDFRSISDAFRSRGQDIWGVSATYNMAHPDDELRKQQTQAAAAYIGSMANLRPRAVTLCTGSGNPTDMWGWDAGTSSAESWSRFRESLDELLPAAEEADLLLAIEPETTNVIAGAEEALRLVKELGADGARIGFIIDPANLVEETVGYKERLSRQYAQLAPGAICVHAKDVVPWDRTLKGEGLTGFALDLYKKHASHLPLIIQDAREDQMTQVLSLVRSSLEED